MRSIYSSRALRGPLGPFSAFSSGASAAETAAAGATTAAAITASGAAGDPNDGSADTWSPGWDQPYSNTTVTIMGKQVPYNIADPSQIGLNPDGIPTNLAAPSSPLPSWVLPLAFGATAFVLLGGWSLVYYGRRRKRRR